MDDAQQHIQTGTRDLSLKQSLCLASIDVQHHKVNRNGDIIILHSKGRGTSISWHPVVHEKFCLLMNKKVSRRVISMSCSSGIVGILKLFTFEGGKSCYSWPSYQHTKEKRIVYFTVFLSTSLFLLVQLLCKRHKGKHRFNPSEDFFLFVNKQNFPFTTNEAEEKVPNPYSTCCFLHSPSDKV